LSTYSQQSSIPPRLTGPEDWPRFGISVEGGILTGAGQEVSIIPEKGLAEMSSDSFIYMVTHKGEHKEKRRLRANAGFTLIELMLVVAIISILAAIAIPNFMSYQARTRQAEAKVGLGGIFTTASSYFALNLTYAVGSISDLGFTPYGAPVYTFNFGGMPINVGSSSGACPGTTWVGPAPAISPASFTAGARGNIDSDPTCDEWTIDDRRNIMNTVNDVLN
jgi:type IV pilus assembly protein PilA